MDEEAAGTHCQISTPALFEGQRVYSPFEWFGDIDRFKQDFVPDPAVQTFVAYKNKAGKACWDGGKDLKASQTYPKLFGQNVQRLYELRANDIRQWAAGISDAAEDVSMSPSEFANGGDPWLDADLEPVFQWLLNSS